MLILNHEEVSVMQNIRRVLRIGAERLHIYLSGSLEKGNGRFCLCPHNLEELAELRAQELQSSTLGAKELPQRKEKPHWQRDFAQEYLLSMLIGDVNQAAKQGFLCLPADPEVVLILKQCFPDKPFVSISSTEPEKAGQTQPGGKRNARAVRSSTGASVAVTLALAAVAVALLLWSDLQYRLWIFLGCLGAGILLGWIYGAGISCYKPTPEGIWVQRGRRKKLFPAKSIKTIARFRVRIGTQVEEVLVFSGLPVEKASDRTQRRLRALRDGDALIIDYLMLPQTRQLYALREYSRKVHRFGERGLRWMAVEYQPESADRIRELYPHAQYLELPEGVY